MEIEIGDNGELLLDLPKGRRIHTFFGTVEYEGGWLYDSSPVNNVKELVPGQIYHLLVEWWSSKGKHHISRDEYYIFAKVENNKAIFEDIGPAEAVALMSMGKRIAEIDSEELKELIKRTRNLLESWKKKALDVVLSLGRLSFRVDIQRGNVVDHITVGVYSDRAKVYSNGKEIWLSYEYPSTVEEINEFMRIFKKGLELYITHASVEEKKKLDKYTKEVQILAKRMQQLQKKREALLDEAIELMKTLARAIYDAVGTRVGDRETGIRITMDGDEPAVKTTRWILGFGKTPTLDEALDAIKKLIILAKKLETKYPSLSDFVKRVCEET